MNGDDDLFIRIGTKEFIGEHYKELLAGELTDNGFCPKAFQMEVN